jgi:hypothetical protein
MIALSAWSVKLCGIEADDLDRARQVRIEHRPVQVDAVRADLHAGEVHLQARLVLVQVVEDRPRPRSVTLTAFVGGFITVMLSGIFRSEIGHLDDALGVALGLRDRVPESAASSSEIELQAGILLDDYREVRRPRDAQALPRGRRSAGRLAVRGPARAERGELHSTSSRCNVVRSVAASTSR